MRGEVSRVQTLVLYIVFLVHGLVKTLVKNLVTNLVKTLVKNLAKIQSEPGAILGKSWVVHRAL